MRIAIFSDVHGNLQAWDAVSRDLRRQSPDMTLCLGDQVGYGPNPQAVLDGVREFCSGAILGDHDALIIRKLPRDSYTEESLRLIDWTRDQLDGDAYYYLSGLPYKIGDDNMLCVHAEPAEPDQFNFVFDDAAAATALAAARQQVVFAGHTHVAGIFEQIGDQQPKWHGDTTFELKTDAKYLINPGSVGDPLDTSPRASYCLFDTNARRITFRRLPFAFENYRRAIAEAGIATTPHCLTHIDSQLIDNPATPGEPGPRPQDLDQLSGLLKRIQP